MADLPDYIDTTWAKKRIASNQKRITQLQARLPRLKGKAAEDAQTQIADLTAENKVLQDKISALALSGKDTGGTTGNYSTVSTSSCAKDQEEKSASGGSAAAAPAQPKGVNRQILIVGGLLIAGAVLLAWRIIKRKKHRG